jgi:iron(III) transport system ATP-binding protein
MAGRDLGPLPPSRRDYGIVFQSYALFPNLNVAENIGYGLRNGRRERQARVAELLERVGLAGSERKYPNQLSGGQQQRVALARALAPGPGMLLLDEPLSALDAQVRASLRLELKRLQQELGITTILVTHDQEEALCLADTVAVMNHGTVEQVGTPEEIYHRPRTRFVADFVGHANWSPVRVSQEGRVLLAGQEIASDPAHPAGPARLFCRPEDLRVVTAAEPDPRGSLLARVEELEFMGPVRRATLRLEQAREIVLRANLGPDDPGLSRGQLVPVRIPSGRMRLFPDDAA